MMVLNMEKNKNPSQFRYLFGVDADDIRPTCIIVPFSSKGLMQTFGINHFFRGNLYGCGSDEQLTIICTHMGSLFVGDAILHLKETPCQNLIFFGACGLVQKSEKADLGSLMIPRETIAMESFTELLTRKTSSLLSTRPHPELFNKLKIFPAGETLHEVRGVSFGSLILEPDYQEQLMIQKIDIIDMESSSFFSAAEASQKKAVALLYVTDIVGELPAYRKFLHEERMLINAAVDKSVQLIKKFASAI